MAPASDNNVDPDMSDPTEPDELEYPPGPGPGMRKALPPPYHPPPPMGATFDYNRVQPTSPDHANSFTNTFLRGILTSIDSKDPVVANAWLETLLDAIDLLPPEIIKREIIIIAVAKGQLSQPVLSRKSCCRLIGKIATKLDQQTVRQEVLPTTLALCQDVEADVRNCMCRHLAFVARGVGLDATKSTILPQLVELSNDEKLEVRLSAIETVVHLLSLLDDDTCTQTIVPLVIKSCDQAKQLEDATLPRIAHHYGRLCHGLTPNLNPDQKTWFLDYYRHLSKLGLGSTKPDPSKSDPSKPMPDIVPVEDKTAMYVECRKECAYNFPAMVLFLGAANFADLLFPIFADFVVDPSSWVRRTIAASLHELAKLIGSNFSITNVQICNLFSDSSLEVLDAMVANMVHVIDALARFGVLQFGQGGQYSHELSSALLHCEEAISRTRNWRLHADCIEKFSCLANCISPVTIQQRFIPMLFTRVTKARALPCRVAAARTLLVILRFTVKMDDRAKIMFRIKEELAHGRSCHVRMLFIRMCEMAISLFSKNYFKQHFYSEFLCLSQDSVPNLRRKLCSMLPRLKSLLSLPSDHQLLQHLEDTVKELLVSEQDKDVLSALQRAIEELDITETGVDGVPSLHPEEDRENDRKLREERLIASMEDQLTKLQKDPPPQTSPRSIKALVGSDRKRSESLPPLNRASSEDNRSIATPTTTATELPPSYSVSKDQQDRSWSNNNSNPMLSPYSSSLENLDPSAREFLVDAGITLDTNSIMNSTSMPNLTQVDKSEQLSEVFEGDKVSEKSDPVAGEFSKFLISNEEMKRYEEEYQKTISIVSKLPSASTTSDPPIVKSPEKSRKSSMLKQPTAFPSSPTRSLPNKIPTYNSKSGLRPPSSTSHIGKPASSLPSPSVSGDFIKRDGGASSGDFMNKRLPSGIRPPKTPSSSVSSIAQSTLSKLSLPSKLSSSTEKIQGSFERLAEKWEAKRRTLDGDERQQRAAVMEQKLQMIKQQGIPTRSMLKPPAQKRLSLTDQVTVVGREAMQKLMVPKRKSLNAEMMYSEGDKRFAEGEKKKPTEGEKRVEDKREEAVDSKMKMKEVRLSVSPRTSPPKEPSPDPDLPPYPEVQKTDSGTELHYIINDSSLPLPPPPPAPTGPPSHSHLPPNTQSYLPPPTHTIRPPSHSPPEEIYVPSLSRQSHMPMPQSAKLVLSTTTSDLVTSSGLVVKPASASPVVTSIAVSRSIPQPQRIVASNTFSLRSPTSPQRNSYLRQSSENLSTRQAPAYTSPRGRLSMTYHGPADNPASYSPRTHPPPYTTSNSTYSSTPSFSSASSLRHPDSTTSRFSQPRQRPTYTSVAMRQSETQRQNEAQQRQNENLRRSVASPEKQRQNENMRRSRPPSTVASPTRQPPPSYNTVMAENKLRYRSTNIRREQPSQATTGIYRRKPSETSPPQNKYPSEPESPSRSDKHVPKYTRVPPPRYRTNNQPPSRRPVSSDYLGHHRSTSSLAPNGDYKDDDLMKQHSKSRSAESILDTERYEETNNEGYLTLPPSSRYSSRSRVMIRPASARSSSPPEQPLPHRRSSSGMRMWQGMNTSRANGSSSRSPSPVQAEREVASVPSSPARYQRYGYSNSGLRRPSSVHSSPGSSRSSSPVNNQKRRSAHYPSSSGSTIPRPGRPSASSSYVRSNIPPPSASKLRYGNRRLPTAPNSSTAKQTEHEEQRFGQRR